MMLFERFISQEFQIIVNCKMRQMDFEPGAEELGAHHELDMKQNSMLLSVTRELPVAPVPKGEKVNNKVKVFPKDKWLKPSLAFPPHDEASSPKDKKRARARRARSPAPIPFQVPKGDGQVIIADSLPSLSCRFCCFF
jgi:hypothetical protein